MVNVLLYHPVVFFVQQYPTGGDSVHPLLSVQQFASKSRKSEAIPTSGAGDIEVQCDPVQLLSIVDGQKVVPNPPHIAFCMITPRNEPNESMVCVIEELCSTANIFDCCKRSLSGTLAACYLLVCECGTAATVCV